MPRPFKLPELRTALLERADLSSASNPPTSEELNRLLDQSRAKWHEILIRKGLRHADKKTDITTQAGVDEYALPEDFYLPVAIQRVVEGLPSEPLPDLNTYEAARSVVSRNVPNADGGAVGYNILGSGVTTRLVLWPPNLPAGLVYRVSYATAAERLTDDGQEVDDIAGGVEFIISDAARKLARPRNVDTAGLERDVAEAKADLNEMAANRTMHGTKRIIDVSGEAGSAGYPVEYGRDPWWRR